MRNNFKYSFNKIQVLDAESFLLMLEAAHELRKMFQENPGNVFQKGLEKYKPMMLILLEYLALNIDNPNLDPEILRFLSKIFGRRLKKNSKKDKVDLEEEVSLEEKEQEARFYIYELYKITNPNRIAGETEVENFISNVKVRGVETARKHEGKECESLFTIKEIKNMESYRDMVRQNIKDRGISGIGL